MRQHKHTPTTLLPGTVLQHCRRPQVAQSCTKRERERKRTRGQAAGKDSSTSVNQLHNPAGILTPACSSFFHSEIVFSSSCSAIRMNSGAAPSKACKVGFTKMSMKPSCALGMFMVALLQKGDTDRPACCSLSPCSQNSWMTRSAHGLAKPKGREGLAMSARCTIIRYSRFRSSHWLTSGTASIWELKFLSSSKWMAMSVASTTSIISCRHFFCSSNVKSSKMSQPLFVRASSKALAMW
mmetsp:Transcript_22213/g.61424  ORF Transcript_22213/g.61424 Transcript_22213/m.61424 type:complete len:239 (-) Transcript_22213:858-1574(-)